MKRILGIDPGSRLMGIGIIESDGRYNRHIYSHTLSIGHETSLPIRLGKIFDTVKDVIEDYSPDEFAIENVFMAKNAASALKLGQARGAAICAAVTSDLSVAEYSPKEIKQSVVGKGSADKTQVQHMVKILLNLQGKLQADAADALAIALCHAHTGALKAKLQNYSN